MRKSPLSNHESPRARELSKCCYRYDQRLYFLCFYDFLDLGASLSFVTLYVANQFEILPEKHCEPFYFYTPVGESILVERVYRDCPISINHKGTMADLVDLNMVYFDVILSME